MTRNTFTAIFGLLLSTTFFPSHAQNTNTDYFATVDGHKMHYQISGSGSRAVVFEAGGGNDHTTWRKTFPAVSRFTTAFCYDRAGYSLSEPATSPRTFKQLAGELHTLLHNSGVQPPYVLVGHSFGGAIIRAFANLFPMEVTGLVFVDPLNENLLNGLNEAKKNDLFASIDSMLSKVPTIGERQELSYGKSEVRAGFPELKLLTFPDVPAALLIAGKGQPSYWISNLIDWYQSIFVNSTEASLQVVPYSSHYIQLDEPEVVVSAIKRVVYPDAENVLMRIIKSKGTDSALGYYRKMRTQYPPEWLSENVLNNIGRSQLKEGRIHEAIEFFKLNAEVHPDVYSTYDSLGEGYMVSGNKALAIENYEKSLQLNPANSNAAKMLKQLKEKP